MRLEIDAGNTWIKWRLRSGVDTVARGAVETLSVGNGVQLQFHQDHCPSEVRVASVASESVNAKIEEATLREYGVAPMWAIVESHCGGVSCGYHNTTQLGVDRWLAVLAAYNELGGDLVVVDAGSAITIDVVRAQGDHMGGFIVPGLNLMRSALRQGTANVKAGENWPERPLLPAVNTEEAVNKGCMIMALSTIKRISREYGGQLVLTGGDAGCLLDHLPGSVQHRPDLVMDGLSFAGVMRR